MSERRASGRPARVRRGWMNKVVRVERTTRHPLYDKVLRRGARYKAHDERNECHVGDRVVIQECRPLSRDKSWRVIEIVRRAR